MDATRLVLSEHLSSYPVENLQKAEEDVRQETEKVLKILQYFQGQFGTGQEMEE